MNWFGRQKAGLKRAWGKLRTVFRAFSGKIRYRALEKESFTVTVGVVEGKIDGRRNVAFEGQRLARRVWAEGEHRVTETLYQVGHGRYLVHTRTLHRTPGLRTELDLHEAGEADLERGRYAPLGRLRPLGLGEAS